MPRHERRRHVPIVRLTALVAAIVAAVVITRTAGSPRFRVLRPGVEFETLRGDPYCRMGSSEIAVLRLDPRRVRLRMAHYSLEPEQAPLDLLDWERRLGARRGVQRRPVLPRQSYMGLFVSDGRVVSSRLHAEFKAALVADPVIGGISARVLDLEQHPIRPDALTWREVAQSFMLFDDDGKIRVRNSSQVAYRTAVGRGRAGPHRRDRHRRRLHAVRARGPAPHLAAQPPAGDVDGWRRGGGARGEHRRIPLRQLRPPQRERTGDASYALDRGATRGRRGDPR
jgi:hypothetical protein